MEGKGIGIEYVDKKKWFGGWKSVLCKWNSGVIYNKVDLGNEKVEEMRVGGKC